MEKRYYYILIPVLLAALAVAGFLGFAFVSASSKVEVPDFLGKNKEEVYEWCGQLSQNYSCELIYEENTSIEKDKVFQQSVSAGNTLDKSITIRISTGIITPIALPDLNDLTKAKVEDWKKANSVANVTYIDEESDTVTPGNVIRIEPNSDIFKDTPVTVFISKGSEKNTGSVIEIKSGEYVNLTVAQFESKVKELGLRPNHNTDKDASSSSVKSGNIVWHGSGTYEKDETINYGVSKGSSASTGDIKVEFGIYIGKTESEFKTLATNLNLSPNHKTEKDAYSDTVTKGNIVWHGSGTYEKNETINYGLSLGKKGSSSEIIVEYGVYLGLSESEFKSKAASLTLSPNHNTSWDAYSDTVAKGNIVKHGSGSYVKDETINYGLSLGRKDGSSEFYIEYGTYFGKTESEFKTIAANLGLSPNHKTEKDAYSDSVAKGNIVWHGSGTYEIGEVFNYGLSLGKGGSSDEFTIYKNTYVGKTESEFKSIAESLGLSPNHRSYWDDYSDTVAKGNIVRHGYGDYVKGETFNYGLSLGSNSSSSEIIVEYGIYLGLSESDFRTKAVNLTLSPNHNTSWDAYSDTVAKGNIVKHGSGSYVKNETINYGLSLGKKDDSSTTYVTVENKAGVSESDFLTYLSALGLKAGTKTTEASSTYGEGKIISNGTGSYAIGSSVNYKVSSGSGSVKTAYLMRPTLYEYCQVENDFAKTKANVQAALSAFSNVSFPDNVSSSTGIKIGTIISIAVDGNESYKAGEYPVDTPIVVRIVSSN